LQFKKRYGVVIVSQIAGWGTLAIKRSQQKHNEVNEENGVCTFTIKKDI
jgi:hypothetical protein